MITNTVEQIGQQIEAGAPILPAVLMVKSEIWNRRCKLKAEKASIERELKEIDASMDFPKAKDIAQPFQAVIVNGNGDNVGKFTVYFSPEKTIREFWAARIS